MASRVAFFYEHAGYSYPAGSDETQQATARRECAERLARAEEIAAARGWYVDTQYDHDDCGDPDDEDIARLLGDGDMVRLLVILHDEDGRYLSTLGGVIVASDDDPYIRVVGAELAAEVISTHQECHGRTTCGNCGHAWCGVCDPAPSALCHWCHGRGWSDAEMDPEYEEA